MLVRVRNFIGDVVLALPALERLAARGLSLELVGKPWLRALLSAYDWPVHVYPARIADRVRLLRSLRDPSEAPGPGRRIDAVTFATSFSSAFELRLAGWRAFGYRTEGRRLFLAESTPIRWGEHALASYWRLTSALLADPAPPPAYATLRLTAEALRRARRLCQERAIGAGYVVLVPFAGGTFEKLDKRWPHFDALAARLRAAGYTLLIVPGPNEVAEAHRRFPDAHVLEGIELDVYAALLRNATLTIANDTGPGHIAAAVGGRLLSVLGPTKVEQWGALGPRVTIVRSWPTWPSPEAVFEAALELLNRADPPFSSAQPES
ncbi:MAG: glycosyltransferase family 9 protein [Burkholderiales bacterium]|nr:glycosyltransferase family 9 protein [Burkholderiales bacterium]